VILLEGDLGSGKTTLVQGIGEGLGITEPIVSPVHPPLMSTQNTLTAVTLDLYRLQPEEVTALNLKATGKALSSIRIVAIEWAERLEYKPPSYLQVHLISQIAIAK